VFIGGYPRTGTTLLLALLDGHPQLVVLPEETRFLRHVADGEAGSPEEAVDRLFRLGYLGHLDPDRGPEAADAAGSGIADYGGFPFRSFRDRTLELYRASGRRAPDLLESTAIAYAEAMGSSFRDARYLVEKTPGNEFRLWRAERWWPDCRLLYTVRDPRAAYDSHLQKWRSDPRGRRELPVEEFVLGYATSLVAVLRKESRQPGSTLMISYEQLVRHPEVELESVREFLGIEPHDSLTVPTKGGRPWAGVGSAGPVGTAVTASRVEAWRSSLPEGDVDYVETFLGKAMLMLGYRTTRSLKSLARMVRMLRGPLSVRRDTLLAVSRLYRPFSTMLPVGTGSPWR
jgi:hypothetical protein